MDMVNKQREAMFSKEGMDKAINDVFKGDTQSLNKINAFINDKLSQEEKAFFENSFPNQHVGLFYKVMNEFMNDFGAKEGGAINNNPVSQGQTKEQVEALRSSLRKEIMELSSKPHSDEQEKALLNKFNATYGR
jgi:hypothetical protein